MWSTSDRKSQLPPDWDAIRRRVGDRDGWVCQWPRDDRRSLVCGQPANQCDHRVNGWDHHEDNLWMLCRWHHTAKTQQESAAARRALQVKAKHPVERHPGLL